MNLVVDEKLMKTHEEYKVIDSEKALVTVRPDTLWSYIKQGEDNVGVAFHGSAKFAIDAIVETENGAFGEAISGELAGIQLYLGANEFEKVSEMASESDLSRLGYPSYFAFRQAVEGKLDSKSKTHGDKIDIRGDGGILIGEDNRETKIVLVVSRANTVLTYGKRVFVLNDKNMVSVDKERVSIGGGDKRTIIIDKDGISGLEELCDLGPAIGRAVSSAMRGISRATRDITRDVHHFHEPHGHRRHGYSKYGAWDNVDEFDWDD